MTVDTDTDTDTGRTVDELVASASRAGETWAATDPAQRRRVLHAVADAVDAAADDLIPLALAETHLLEGRLRGELTRTTFQLRLLADAAARGDHLDVRVDTADADWPMGARPDLRRTAVPLGPVVVFAASNFPFAFSVAGGDTASALAAGCPVIVKAHEGHPQLSVATGGVVVRALRESAAPNGLFALVHDPVTAREALTHPDVKAGAFTGSLAAGRALFDLAQARPEPIPFYGELGSVNPVFVTERAAADRARDIIDGFVGSFTLGAGQFCTKPGLLIVPEQSRILQLLADLSLPAPAPLLNDRIVEGHRRGRDELAAHTDVSLLAGGRAQIGNPPAPVLLTATAQAVLADMKALTTECFGPTALVITYRDEQQLLHLARALEGQLTATIAAEPDDVITAELLPILARKAGRLLWNQWPTGVTVSYAQQHGGPYPATTASATTSVGTAAIARFVRPVAWQGFPEQLLPIELRGDAAGTTARRVNGRLVPGETA